MVMTGLSFLLLLPSVNTNYALTPGCDPFKKSSAVITGDRNKLIMDFVFGKLSDDPLKFLLKRGIVIKAASLLPQKLLFPVLRQFFYLLHCKASLGEIAKQ